MYHNIVSYICYNKTHNNNVVGRSKFNHVTKSTSTRARGSHGGTIGTAMGRTGRTGKHGNNGNNGKTETPSKRESGNTGTTGKPGEEREQRENINNESIINNNNAVIHPSINQSNTRAAWL